MLSRSIALLIFTATLAPGQRLTGTVRAANTPTVISGVVVSTVDSAGRIIARALSDQNGRYSLPLVPSATHVRAVRIGYRPANVRIEPTSNGHLDVTLERMPFVLETMRVTADANCAPSQDAPVVQAIWDQARSALLAAIVARESNPAQVRLLSYERRMDRSRRLITEQRVLSSEGRSSRPVSAARTGAQLAASGYRATDGRGDVYFAPDADVLFDDSFVQAHCFGLTKGSRDRAGQVGLTFKPREWKRDFVDVDGVLWIDPRKPELLQLDYRYTGLDPEAARAGAGGTMHLQTTPSGVVLIDAWSILIPTMTEIRQRGADGTPGSRGVVNDLVEAGGFVLEARWSDGTRWAQPTGGVQGTVREKGGAPVRGVAVSVAGVVSETNQSGAYSLVPLPPGRYRLTMLDSAYGAYAPQRQQSREVTLGRSDTVVADFEVRPRMSILADLCRGDIQHGPAGVVLGAISDGSGSIPQGLQVEVSWYAAGAGSESFDINRVSKEAQVTSPSAAGRFHVCGVPRVSSWITLRATIGRTPVSDTLLIPSSGDSTTTGPREIDWVLSQGAFAAAMRQDAAVVRGRVLSDGKPVARAAVWMVFADTTVHTDSLGRFRVGGLRAGTHMVEVRRMGYLVARDTLVLRARSETVRDFTMKAGQALDTVRTIGEGRAYETPRLQDFEKRRLSGMGGHFISEDELRKHESRSVADVLRTYSPGIRFEPYRGQLFLSSAASPVLTLMKIPPNGPTGCWASIYLDGTLLYGGEPGSIPPDMNQFLAMNLSGIEYYGGSATLPLQFKSTKNACGTLLMWTRGK